MRVEGLVAQDQAIARWVVGILHLFSIYPKLAWDDLRNQSEELVLRELDFRYEEHPCVSSRGSCAATKSTFRIRFANTAASACW